MGDSQNTTITRSVCTGATSSLSCQIHVWHWDCATRATSARSATPALRYQAASRLLNNTWARPHPDTGYGAGMSSQSCRPVPRSQDVVAYPLVWLLLAGLLPLLAAFLFYPCRPSQEKVAIQCDCASHIVMAFVTGRTETTDTTGVVVTIPVPASNQITVLGGNGG